MNKVLIIDDEGNIRRMMRLTLEAAGYEVGEAGNGPQGLEVYGDGSGWDVVLLDQRMPGMDGLETLRQLQQRGGAARVIMVTAYASVELAVDAMKLGARDFVRKPMTPEILRGAIAAAVSRTSRRKAAEKETRPDRPQIETLILNGFEIMSPPDAGVTRTQPGEHAFVVQSPDGKRSTVTVKIDDGVPAYVERMTKRRLAADNSFWALMAERLLSDYLWDEGHVPAEGKLTLRELDREQLLTAERWTS